MKKQKITITIDINEKHCDMDYLLDDLIQLIDKDEITSGILHYGNNIVKWEVTREQLG